MRGTNNRNEGYGFDGRGYDAWPGAMAHIPTRCATGTRHSMHGTLGGMGPDPARMLHTAQLRRMSRGARTRMLPPRSRTRVRSIATGR
jgi:hypothetical protein